MRRTLVYGTATAVVALTLTGCPAREVATLYGPPPGAEEEASSQQEAQATSQSQQSEVDEPIEDVYGPPVSEEVLSIEGEEEDIEAVPALYGPPPEDIG